MKCTINDVNLSFDKDNRLRSTIGRVTGANIDKAYVLASFFKDDDFKNFLFKNITKEDFLKDQYVSKESFTDNDYVKINQNKLGSLLNLYYIDHYHSVSESSTNKGLGGLNGFTSVSAKTVAKNHTSSIIIEEYEKEITKPRPYRRSAEQIIRDVNNIILNNFYDRVGRFVDNVLNTDKYSDNAKEYAGKYKELLDRLIELKNNNRTDVTRRNGLNDSIGSINDEIIELKKQGIEFKEAGDAENTKRIYTEYKQKQEEIKKLIAERNKIEATIKSRNKEGAIYARDKYAMAQNLINLYTNNVDGNLKVTLRNYANLVSQTKANANEWYFQVFNSKYMTSVVKEFNKVGDIAEYLEEADTNNDSIESKFNDESIDETTKSWEDNLYRSFNQTISSRLRMILSRIPKMNQPFNATDPVEGIDTNNELGVPTYMDSTYIITQIYAFAECNDIDTFIDSIKEKANTIKGIYGLGAIVDMMENDKVFANYMFANFAKPIVHKTMLIVEDINSENGITFDYSNSNAFSELEMTYRIANKIRATYDTSYNSKDLVELNTVQTDFKSKDVNRINAAKEKLFNIIIKYIPNYNRDYFNNFFDNNKDDKLVEDLITSVNQIISGIGSLKDTINKEKEILNEKNQKNWKDYITAKNEYNKLKAKDRKDKKAPAIPEMEYFDYTGIDLTKTTYKGIIRFSNIMSKYSDAKIRLNSVNADGNSSSNVIKNCFVSRLFEQINAGTKEDANAGLKILLDYFTQGTDGNRENQYSNNPLLFGLKDADGNVISPGLFTKTATGYEINSNAKEILKYSLFDGTKNLQDENSAGYAQMTELDFFITQYIAFNKSVEESSTGERTKKIGNLDSAVYPMRIGSDAPKIFFIRAPKYKNNQVHYAIYNHVIDELNMLCNGLTQLFVKEGDYFRLRKDIKNLIGRTFFDEKIANSIKEKGGTDFTKAITDGNKLLGNLFKFNRLFKIDGYDASQAIESLLFLYGGSDSGSLIVPSNDGSLMIEAKNATNGAIVWNGDRFVLNLSDTHKQSLKNVVREWSKHFLNDANVNLGEFTDVLNHTSIKYNSETINNFLLNLVNMNMNYDDLFEGDYKYYKNARDFFKRAKESQAGGDGYAGYSLLDSNYAKLHELTWRGNPDYINIKVTKNGAKGKYTVPTYENGRIVEKPMTARNGWRGVTIYNTIKASDMAEQMQQELERDFIAQGMDKDLAKKRSTQIASGYGHNAGEIKGDKTIINDAQSYITLEEFTRRKYADGTINEYMDLISQLLDPNVSIDQLNLDEINARIQVQKNFYYDKPYDSDLNVYRPRQIKNAEYVLIPKLLGEATELRKIYDWMRANDIGQINTAETSKAAKKNIFTIWDSNTGKFDENFADKFDDDYAENYYYQYLYKQQDVPQHLTDEHNKAGSQLTKVILNNIYNDIYANDTERQVLINAANDYETAYTANIRESFEEFLDNMGWVYDKTTGKVINATYDTVDFNGNPLPKEIIESNRDTLKFDRFFERAREEAARLGMDSNFMEYLIPDETSNPKMLNWMNLNANKLESIAQSLYNNRITRQTLPGWHAAQITGVGYSNKLNFDPETGTMEVRLPRWSKLIPKGKNAEEDAEILKQIQEEGLDIHLGYRMPTEGKQSVAILRVVGFVNDCLGSTVVVPEEWVTQTGSDFDVDTIYGVCWEMYRTNENGKITVHKVPFEENKVDNEHLYIKYVNNKLDNKISNVAIGDRINDRIKELKDAINLDRDNVSETNNKNFTKIDALRNEAFKKLPKWARGVIKDANAKYIKVRKDGSRITDIKEAYPDIINTFEKYLEKHKVEEVDKVNVEEYIDYLNGILDVIKTQEDYITSSKEKYKTDKANAIKEIVESAKKEYFDKVQSVAKETGLLSFEEFKKLPIIERLDRRARNNYILDKFVTIMQHQYSHEEQYARSNFEKITNGVDGANDVVNNLYDSKSKEDSPYNPIDQLKWFDDGMSGARLKARSVMWDTFASKLNKIRPKLSKGDGVKVIMDVEETSAVDSSISYDETQIRQSYGEDIEDYNKPVKKLEVKKVDGVGDKINNYILHTGSQYNGSFTDGGDNIFNEIANEYGIKTKPYAPQDYDSLSKEEKEKVEKAYAKSVEELKRRFLKITDRGGKLVRRDYLQAMHGDAVFAIGNIIAPGQNNKYGIPSKADHEVVDGGTGYAVQMAIDMGKPVHVYNYTKGCWYKWDYNDKKFKRENTPQLTPNFTGIGTRDVERNEHVKNAIRELFYITKNGNADIIKKKEDSVKKSTEKPKKQILFNARRIGWSNDNRNTVGELCTNYTAQTTAHHLDAIKMGSIPNVNEYTFDVYKLMSAVGIDFETVIGFIRNPIITKLVANNNLTNSIFINSNSNPIKMTIVDIAKSLGLKNGKNDITEFTKYENIIDGFKSIPAFVEAFENLYGIDILDMDAKTILDLNLPINKQRLFTRIKREVQGKGDKFENAAFDFGILLTFKQIQTTGSIVNDYIRATNADRYGAKISMRETRNIKNLVERLRTDMTISKDGKSLMDIIFPLDNNSHIDIEKSEYKFIAAVYDYATLTSLDTNTQLFVTENDDFTDAEQTIAKAIRHRFTEAEYKEYKKYAITYLYNNIALFLNPTTIDERGNIVIDNERKKEYDSKETYWNQERSRIYGFGITTDGAFEPEDINNPTTNDLQRFNKLTPAQKVMFIQKHFADNQGIFNYIKVTLLNNTDIKYKGISRQYLSYDDQTDNIEDMLFMFGQSFSNHNKFIRLATIDLIKYAFIAEGFNFKSGYISKIIPNNTLYTSVNDGGLGIINTMRILIDELPSQIRSDEFIDNFVRSHSNTIPVVRMPKLPNKTIDEFGFERFEKNNVTTRLLGLTRTDGLIYLDATIDDKLLQELIGRLKLSERVDSYIRINSANVNNVPSTKLYKVKAANPVINDTGNIVKDGKNNTVYKDYFLIPLNLLDKYETYDYSYNQSYNTNAEQSYYDDVIESIKAVRTPDRVGSKETINDVYRDIKAKVPSVPQPVGKYTVEKEFDLKNNPLALMDAYDRADPHTKGAVRKLVDSIIGYFNNPDNADKTFYGHFNPSYELSLLIPTGSVVYQTIFLDDNRSIPVAINHMQITSRVVRGLAAMKQDASRRKEFADAIQEMEESKTEITAPSKTKSPLYRIIRVKENNETVANRVLKAVTDLADDGNDYGSSNNSARRGNSPIDVVAKSIIDEVNYNSRKNGDDIAKRFMRQIEKHRVNRFMGSSIREHKGDVYVNAARYYRSTANALINELEKFIIAGEEYRMDDPEMYEALGKHDEYFGEVSRIILDAMTFGNRIHDIFNLDLTAETKEIKDAVEGIRESINSIRNNAIVNKAIANMVNVYFKKYSTNPDIIDGLLDLRETFGDLDTIDFWFSNPVDIDNNEVQVITKQVYALINKAELFDAAKNVKEYRDSIAKIKAMPGTINWNNIVDGKRGALRASYNNDYLEDRQKLINEYNDARFHKFDNAESFKRYVIAKYNRDKFIHEHSEQIIVPEYYDKDLANRKYAMDKAGDVYYEYLRISEELNDIKNDVFDSDEERSERKRILLNKRRQLLSETDEVGSPKDIVTRSKIAVLNKFIKIKKELNEEYFDHQEYDGFREDYERYNAYIKKYDAENITKSLEEKLENAGYKEAYDWIKNNGSLKYSKELSERLQRALKDVSGRKTVLSKKTISRLKKLDGVMDSTGRINPLNLTDAQIDALRQEEMGDLSYLYDSGFGEAMLLKIVPNDLPIPRSSRLKNTSHQEILKALKYSDNVKKFKTIERINEILGKAVNKDSGRIELDVLFNDEIVSDSERKELAQLYKTLDEIKHLKAEHFKRHKTPIYNDMIYEEGFMDAMNYYNLNLKNTKQGRQFLDIFLVIDEHGTAVANPFIFGFHTYDPEILDENKMAGIKFIKENVDFVPTEYYYQALRQAQENGTYDEWFKRNHIYNPNTHRYQPLKIWTTMVAKPGSELAESIEYVPTFENTDRSVKDKYVNNKTNRQRYKLDGDGYKEFGNNYKKGDSKYDTNVTLNSKEQAIRDLFEQTLNKYATTYQGKRFVGQGYLPRDRKVIMDTRWGLSQIASLLGISYYSNAESDTFSEQVDYSHDKEADMKMLQLIKDKGSKKYKTLPNRAEFDTDEEYNTALKRVREENRKIQEENLKIDNAVLNKDWINVMEQFVHNATIFNAIQSTKPYLHLLLEDLSVNNAYMIDGLWNKHLIKDRVRSTDDDTQYRTIPQTRTRDLVHNLTRRLLFDQYHKKSAQRSVANFLQNLTSAKYMVANAYGGIANIATGKVNIRMEAFANDYFGYKTLVDAERNYLSHSVSYLADLYSDKASNITSAFIKKFNVVDFDQMLQFGAGSEGLDVKIGRLRNWMYSFQSVGEHYMQNTVLLAMLKSNRLYTDSDGVRRIGDFKDYTQDIEKLAMQDVLKDNKTLLDNYNLYRESIKYDVKEKLNIDTGRSNINRNYLLSLRNAGKDGEALFNSIVDKYNARRDKLMKDAERKFLKEGKTVESLFDFVNGEVVLKKNVVDDFNKLGKNKIGDLNKLIAEFRQKVIEVNHKIHGCYDKNSAAYLESKWFGSIIMQYHKHLFTGIFKRWRRKGFYSEYRGSREYGSYQTLIDFLGTEFRNFGDRRKNLEQNGTNTCLASLQIAMQSIINTIHNYNTNKKLLATWEKHNLRRNLGDLSGVLIACALVAVLYGMYDDDEINDDRFKASLLYLSDRLYAETTMYTPMGVVSESKTLWSSPIASANGPSDLIKLMQFTTQWMFDPEFNVEYQSGQWSGRNKFEILLRRNIPGVRPYDRVMSIDKNNSYYKIGKSQIGVNIAKNIGESANE